MNERNKSGGDSDPFMSGWEVRCHICGDVLPLLHPHIIAERYDQEENLICEHCFEKLCSES